MNKPNKRASCLILMVLLALFPVSCDFSGQKSKMGGETVPAPIFTVKPISESSTITAATESTAPPVQATVKSVPVHLKNWPEHMVVYKVNLRAFSPGGDIQGVIVRLDEIKTLGENVIWLMPIYPAGDLKSVNSPYCPRQIWKVKLAGRVYTQTCPTGF